MEVPVNTTAIARILFGVFYLLMALGLVKDFNVVTGLMTSKGIPAAQVLLPITILVWCVGALGLIFHVMPKESILILMLLTILVTPVIHNFWSASPEMFANELQHFLKNLAIVAGLLALLGTMRT